jgi:hypothetical protein
MPLAGSNHSSVLVYLRLEGMFIILISLNFLNRQDAESAKVELMTPKKAEFTR